MLYGMMLHAGVVSAALLYRGTMPRIQASPSSALQPAVPGPRIVRTQEVKTVAKLADLKVSLSLVAVSGRVQYVSGTSKTYPQQTLRISDDSGAIWVKASGPAFRDLAVDAFVTLSEMTVHRAVNSDDELELHYEMADAADAKKRRLSRALCLELVGKTFCCGCTLISFGSMSCCNKA